MNPSCVYFAKTTFWISATLFLIVLSISIWDLEQQLRLLPEKIDMHMIGIRSELVEQVTITRNVTLEHVGQIEKRLDGIDYAARQIGNAASQVTKLGEKINRDDHWYEKMFKYVGWIFKIIK